MSDDDQVFPPPVEHAFLPGRVRPVVIGAVGEMMQRRAPYRMVGRVDARVRGDIDELADACGPGLRILHHVGIIVERRLQDNAPLGDFGVAPDEAADDFGGRVHKRRLAQTGRSGARDWRGVHAASLHRERRHVYHAVGQARANVFVVENREEPRAALPPLSDQFDDRVAILSVQRGGRLVEDQQRVLPGETARDLDPLLLAARKRRPAVRSQQPWGLSQARQRGRARLRRLGL